MFHNFSKCSNERFLKSFLKERKVFNFLSLRYEMIFNLFHCRRKRQVFISFEKESLTICRYAMICQRHMPRLLSFSSCVVYGFLKVYFLHIGIYPYPNVRKNYFFSKKKKEKKSFKNKAGGNICNDMPICHRAIMRENNEGRKKCAVHGKPQVWVKTVVVVVLSSFAHREKAQACARWRTPGTAQ